MTFLIFMKNISIMLLLGFAAFCLGEILATITKENLPLYYEIIKIVAPSTYFIAKNILELNKKNA